MSNQEKIESIQLNGREYVPIDSIKAPEPDVLDGLPYAIVRSREQGVMCGYVESVNGRTVKLKRARQIWRYDSRFVLPDLAEFGPRNANNCKFSAPMSQTATMLEACGILECTVTAGEALRSVASQDKS